MLSSDVPRMKMLIIVRLDAQVTVVKRGKRSKTEEKDREVKKKKSGQEELRQVSCWNIAKPAPADCQHHQDSVITENKCMASAEHTHFLPFNSFFSFTLKAFAIDFRFIVLNIVSKLANIIYGKKKRSPGEGSGNPLRILAQRIPRTKEPDRLQSLELERSGHN